MYPQEYIRAIFSQYDASIRDNSYLANEVKESEKLIYERIKDKYAHLDDADLKEIIHFGTILWNPAEMIEFRNDDYCNRCGYCCTETSPILIQSFEAKKYLADPFFKDNILPNGDDFKFRQDLPCKYYDESNKKCKIYKKRPKNCKLYPFGGLAFYINPKCSYALKVATNKIVVLIKECESL